MFCWGSSLHGELGLGGIEDEQIFTPVASTWVQANKVSNAACGENHTLFLTSDGKIFSCGNNDYSQLGHNLPRKRPQFIESLQSYKMTLVSCGAEHSLAVNEWGQVFSWGAGNVGQLGLDVSVSSQPTPKIIRDLAVMQAVQIACGSYHSVALMSNGDMYSWGSNNHGQLGLGPSGISYEARPKLIKSLAGIPFAYVACGGHHTFAVTKSGAVFGWGKNEFGQLGLNDGLDRCFPTQLRSLRSINICQVDCGEDFTAFLTLDGGVFTCGSGRYGQLGHGDNKDEMLPRKIMELMGSAIVQVACGRRHLIVATASGRLQACGLAGCGQLGSLSSPAPTLVSLPRIVSMPWHQPIQYSGGISNNIKLLRIFSGGDRCFATISDDSCAPFDSRLINPDIQILTINVEHLKACRLLKDGEQVGQDLLAYLETVFKSLNCLNASFLTPSLSHYCCNTKNNGVDINQVMEAFGTIGQIENTTVKEVILQCVTAGLMESLNPNPPDAESLRYFLSLPLYHEMLNPRLWLTLQFPLATAFTSLKSPPLKIIAAWYHSVPKDVFERIIDVYKLVVNQYIDEGVARNQKMIINNVKILPFLQSLEKLSWINMTNAQNKRLSPEAFYLHNLGELVDIKGDYLSWLSDSPGNSQFYLCHYPFLFDALSKTRLLELDQAMQMQQAMSEAATMAIHSLLTGGLPPPQLILLQVSRENIVSDTLTELSHYGPSDLKKPLKVKFHNEEAEDAGGVRKEFFLLLLREILDPKFGMFQYYPDSRCVWFAEESFEEENMFYLIGLICGLAIYNFTIINVNFPLALYKKLLNAPVTLEDLEDINPTVAKSLQSLLDYKGSDVEDVFGLYFEISRDIYGTVKVFQLKENGGNISVTNENKEEFVNLYVDFIFNKSIEKKFDAFYKGFYKVCSGRVFKLFQPHELMTFVVGNEKYDWDELERAASYRGGYTESDPVIRAFWEVFNELSHEEKKNFLLFLTGCDRIPIQGMKAIRITIQPTTDDRFLPVAHTCFNLLDLPRYSTKEKLKYKLLQAIQQNEGFSLV
ncbi:HECT and RLD domain containing E3 ubiquitin ligase 4 isoform X2 [Arctopsyche grandis]|uniref:HECT and RLD domain containing E3 ubiquitin ligase 4 isoform X2 n=1 Tax=Arctopsyche grandis TaxID=121162 RepID=UPI00406D7E59